MGFIAHNKTVREGIDSRFPTPSSPKHERRGRQSVERQVFHWLQPFENTFLLQKSISIE